MTWKCVAVCLTLVILGPTPSGADDAPRRNTGYDLVIRNGRIVDGSGNPWFVGDVAVRAGRIVAVGRVPPGPAKRTLDALPCRLQKCRALVSITPGTGGCHPVCLHLESHPEAPEGEKRLSASESWA